mgnify:CR=1 FL=1
MRKQLENFLIDISEIYPIPTKLHYEKVIEQYTDYLHEFCFNKQIDFKKAKHYIYEHYQYRNYPDMQTIKDSLYTAEVTQYQQCVDEGALLVVTLPSGYKYRFTVSALGRKKETIEKDILRRFGECKYQFYPKGTIISGETVFTP